MSSVGFTHRRNSCWLTLSCCNELNESLRKNFSKLRTQLRVFLFMNIYFTRFNQLINLIREICDFNRRIFPCVIQYILLFTYFIPSSLIPCSSPSSFSPQKTLCIILRILVLRVIPLWRFYLSEDESISMIPVFLQLIQFFSHFAGFKKITYFVSDLCGLYGALFGLNEICTKFLTHRRAQ